MQRLRATITFGIRELQETIAACKQRIAWIDEQLASEPDDDRYSNLANDSIPLHAALAAFEQELARIMTEHAKLDQAYKARERKQSGLEGG